MYSNKNYGYCKITVSKSNKNICFEDIYLHIWYNKSYKYCKLNSEDNEHQVSVLDGLTVTIVVDDDIPYTYMEGNIL